MFLLKTGLRSCGFHQTVAQRLVFADIKMLRKFEGYHPQRDHPGIMKALENQYARCNCAVDSYFTLLAATTAPYFIVYSKIAVAN